MEMKNVEEKRQQNVEKAMEDLLEKYCKYRMDLNGQMENKMRRAESLRKERLDSETTIIISIVSSAGTIKAGTSCIFISGQVTSGRPVLATATIFLVTMDIHFQ